MSEPARLVPTQGTTWPTATVYLPGTIRITYQAGSYGDGVEVNTIPQTVISAMLLLINHLYENRSSSSESAVKEIPLGTKMLLNTVKFDTFTYETGY